MYMFVTGKGVAVTWVPVAERLMFGRMKVQLVLVVLPTGLPSRTFVNKLALMTGLALVVEAFILFESRTDRLAKLNPPWGSNSHWVPGLEETRDKIFPVVPCKVVVPSTVVVALAVKAKVVEALTVLVRL